MTKAGHLAGLLILLQLEKSYRLAVAILEFPSENNDQVDHPTDQQVTKGQRV